MVLHKANARNARRLARAIRSNPGQYDQTRWFNLDRLSAKMFEMLGVWGQGGLVDALASNGAKTVKDVQACGAPACIAGWACYLWPKTLHGRPEVRLEAALGLPSLATRAITGSGTPGDVVARWPEPWRARYRKAKIKRTRANVAADMLEALADGSLQWEVENTLLVENTLSGHWVVVGA